MMRFGLLCLLALVSLKFLAAPAGATPRMGFFWDTGYTQTRMETGEGFPPLTGYLVMWDVPDTSGVLGFRLHLGTTGPVTVTGYEFADAGTNLIEWQEYIDFHFDLPQFPVGGYVPLATFSMQPTALGPATILLNPLYEPGGWGGMSWISTSDPETRLLVTTVDGGRLAATINGHLPVVSPDTLAFDTMLVGTAAVTRNVLLENVGFDPIDLELSMEPGCDVFGLTSVQGAVQVPAASTLEVPVEFTPLTVGDHACALQFGIGISPVAVVGTCRDSIRAHSVIPIRDYGDIDLGGHLDKNTRFINTGEAVQVVSPELVGCAGQFQIISGGETVALESGDGHFVTVRFAPDSLGTFDCALSWGEGFDQTDLLGNGVDIPHEWTIAGDFDFEVPLGAWGNRSIHITNTGDHGITSYPGLLDCSEEVWLWSENLFSIAPGATHRVGLTFRPEGPDGVQCTADFDHPIGSVPVDVRVRAEPISVVAPDTVDFGSGYTAMGVTVRNDDDVTFRVEPRIADCLHDFELGYGTRPEILAPGDSMSFTVTYYQYPDWAEACTLELGTGLPSVALVANLIPDPDAQWVTPESHAFDATPPDSVRGFIFKVSNIGKAALDFLPTLTGPGFELGSTWEPRVLLPNDQPQYVGVRFAPDAYGTYEGVLEFGEGFPSVPLTGVCAEIVTGCDVSTTAIDFGSFELYPASAETVTVANPGNVTLNAWAQGARGAGRLHPFVVEPESASIAPGDSMQFTVSFSTFTPDTYSDTLYFGTGCDFITLDADMYLPDPPERPDRLGIFFDPEFETDIIQMAPGETGTAYLVLRDPSGYQSISGWEARIAIDGEAEIQSWNLHYPSYNFLSPPNFRARTFPCDNNCGGQWDCWIQCGTGLPWQPDILLLEFQFRVLGAEPVSFRLEPVPYPAFDGQMAWYAGRHAYCRYDDSVMMCAGATINLLDPRPVTTMTGSPVVAMVNSQASGTPVNLPPATTRLLSNVPNPFNPQTEIRFETRKAGPVRVAVFDLAGRRVTVLQDGHLEPGRWTRVWDGRDGSGRQVASGAYYVRLEADGRVDHRKVLLLK